MKKREPNLTSFCTIKKRTWYFYPPLSKKKKKCLYLDIYLLRWINHTPSILLTNMYPNPSRVICINTYSVDPFFCARNQIWTGDTRIFNPLLYQLSYPDHLLCIILVEYLYLCQLKGLKNKLNKVFQIRNCKMGGVVLCIVHGLLNNTEK